MGDEMKIIKREDYLKSNPEMVFRKEDDGAFLFDPDTGNLKYLNRNGVNIYELCDGRKTIGEITSILKGIYKETAAETIAADTESFVEELVTMKFLMRCEQIGY